MLVPLTDPNGPYAAMMLQLIEAHLARAAAGDTIEPARPTTRRPSIVSRALGTVTVLPSRLRFRSGTL